MNKVVVVVAVLSASMGTAGAAEIGSEPRDHVYAHTQRHDANGLHEFGRHFALTYAHGRHYVIDLSTHQIVYSPDFPPYRPVEFGYVQMHGQPVLVDFTHGIALTR